MIGKKIPAGGNRRANGAESSGREGLSVANNPGGSYHSRGNVATSDAGPGVLSLAGAGVEFTLPKRGDKQPFTKSWPSYRPELSAVLEHIAGGGNLGVHVKGYTDGWILAYFDGDDSAGIDDLLTVAPYLADSLRSWRRSGSGKIFVWVHDPAGEIRNQSTPNLAGAHSKRELKGSGQATISGVHPSGERYECNWAAPIVLTVDQIKEIWEAWTGQQWKTLQPKPAPNVERKPIVDDGGLLSQLRAYWTAYAVFEHFGRVTEVLQGQEWKLRGNGGLFVGNPDGPESWRWFCFSEDVGGDAFDAWSYCTRGRVLARGNKREFVETLREMAAAAGLDFDGPDDEPRRIIHHETGEILDADRLAVAGRAMLTGRTRQTDGAAWLAVLEIMLSAGADVCPISTRHLADLAGVSQATANRALGRLVDAGLLLRIQTPTGFLDATIYGLTAAIVQNDSHSRQAGGDWGPCESLWTIGDAARTETAQSLLSDHLLEDAWRNSPPIRKDAMGRSLSSPTPAGAGLGSLGHTGRELLATLDAYGTGNLSQLSEWARMGRATVSRLADYLAQLGIVEIAQSGRAKLVSLVDDWRERLAEIVPSMVTRGKCRRQRLVHASQRIERAERYVRTVAGRIRKDAALLAEKIINRAKGLQAALGDVVRGFSEGIRAAVHRIGLGVRASRSDVLDERRASSYEGLMYRANALLSGGLLTGWELAELRTVTGRLGVNLANLDAIDSAGGYVWGVAQ